MHCKRFTVLSAAWTMSIALLGLQGLAHADKPIVVTGEGTGTFFPASGLYVADGEVDPFGKSVGTGRVETEPTGPTTFTFQSHGLGTPDEFLDRFMTTEGTMFLRLGPGTVELIPDLSNPNFDPALGPYTAHWTAVNRVVRGTGKFLGARGEINITATNLPFLLTDPEWHFTWTWDGVIRVPPRN